MVAFEVGHPREAPGIAVDGAGALAPADPAAMIGLIDSAIVYAWEIGVTPEQEEAFRRIEALMAAVPGQSSTLLKLYTASRRLLDDPAEGTSLLRLALAEARRDGPSWARLRIAAPTLELTMGDFPAARETAVDLVAGFRAAGRIGLLPQVLSVLAVAEMFLDRPRDAMAGAHEALRVAEDTGQTHRVGYLTAVLAWVRACFGDEDACRALVERAHGRSLNGERMTILAWAHLASVTMDLSRCRYEAVLEHFERIAVGPARSSTTAMIYSAPDHVEAAVRARRPEEAALPLARFTAWAEATGETWALAVAARLAALAAPDEEAEAHYERARALHWQSRRGLECARTELVYGEWLRRTLRRSDARAHLRTAMEIFDSLEARAWSERAAAELRAAGATVGPRSAPADPLATLTPQELQVVRLAATGASNREIGAQLFLSPRTVGYHLYKAYPKLGVSSRVELAARVGAGSLTVIEDAVA
jgi:DNA-binding CsgD family transcriptional regulator